MFVNPFSDQGNSEVYIGRDGAMNFLSGEMDEVSCDLVPVSLCPLQTAIVLRQEQSVLQ